MDLKTAKQIFMSSRDAEGITTATRKGYESTLKKFLLYIIKEKDIYTIDQLNSTIINAFLAHVKAGGVKNVSVHKDFRIVRTFCLYLYQNSFIDFNPMQGVKAPIKEHRVIRTFSAAEIKKLLAAYDQDDFFGMRNYCMLSLLFSTGLRKKELCSIKIDDINITNELIKIHGKGQKERLIPIGRIMKRILLKFFEEREEYIKRNHINTNYLFISKSGQGLTLDGVGGLFYKLKKELKIEGERINCHTWRHTFAKNYLLNGGDLFSLQKILGHASITSTKMYLNLNEEEMKRQHAKYNPLDNSDWLL